MTNKAFISCRVLDDNHEPGKAHLFMPTDNENFYNKMSRFLILKPLDDSYYEVVSKSPEYNQTEKDLNHYIRTVCKDVITLEIPQLKTEVEEVNIGVGKIYIYSLGW